MFRGKRSAGVDLPFQAGEIADRGASAWSARAIGPSRIGGNLGAQAPLFGSHTRAPRLSAGRLLRHRDSGRDKPGPDARPRRTASQALYRMLAQQHKITRSAATTNQTPGTPRTRSTSRCPPPAPAYTASSTPPSSRSAAPPPSDSSTPAPSTLSSTMSPTCTKPRWQPRSPSPSTPRPRVSDTA